MTGEENLRNVKTMRRLKGDVIEAGFAMASLGDSAAVLAGKKRGIFDALSKRFSPPRSAGRTEAFKTGYA